MALYTVTLRSEHGARKTLYAEGQNETIAIAAARKRFQRECPHSKNLKTYVVSLRLRDGDF